MKRASVISVGNELLNGRGVDTNSRYLSEKLLSIGIPTVSGFTVGDDITMIVDTLKQASKHTDIVIMTGGLGPTDDDITRNGLADFLGAKLLFEDEILRTISQFFEKHCLEMSEKNRVQAYIPDGATALRNEVGTAPGIMAKKGGKFYFCLPGVPLEMERMFELSVLPVLGKESSGQVVLTRRIHCFGTGESTIAQILGDIMDRGRNPLINCTVSGGIITLHIIASAKDRNSAGEMLEKDTEKLNKVLGKLVFGIDDQTLAEVVGQYLKENGKTIATAESCTGGLLAKLITDISGASDYFLGGWITYTNESKIRELGVKQKTIAEYGAVSEQVAAAMASGARKKSGGNFGIGITGIAGPVGGIHEKPVGLVYIGIDFEDSVEVSRYVFSHSREYIRLRSALTALNLVRLAMQG